MAPTVEREVRSQASMLVLAAALATLYASLFTRAAGRWPLSPLYFLLCLALGALGSGLLGLATARLRLPLALSFSLWVALTQLTAVRWWIWRIEGPLPVAAQCLLPAAVVGAALAVARPVPRGAAIAAAGATFFQAVIYPGWTLPAFGLAAWFVEWVRPSLTVFLVCLALALGSRRGRGLAWRLALGAALPLLAAVLWAWREAPLLPRPPMQSTTSGPPRPAAAVAPVSPSSRGSSQGPPILVVVLDTVRADHLSWDGHSRPTTPRLDALLRDGRPAAVYRRAFANGNWTIPSHGSLLTGLLPSDHGARFELGEDGERQRVATLRPEVTTLAERLRAGGYESHGVVANPQLVLAGGLARGFDSFGLPPSTSGIPVLGEHLRRLALPGLFPDALLAHPAAPQVNDWVLAAIDACQGRPCFVLANYFEPHALYAPPEACRGRFLPWSWREPIAHPLLSHPPALLSRLAVRYDEEICALDLAVADLLAELDRRRFFERGWVFITSDHGEAFGEHGVTEHGTALYDEEVRVPLVVLPPRGEPIAASAEPVDLLDVAATVAAIAGLELPGAGRDLRRPLARRPVAIETTGDLGKAEFCGALAAEPGRAVVLGGLKLIEHGARRELYDLDADAGETRDLAAARPDLVAALAALLPRVAAATVPAPPALTPEQRQALEALGYVN